MKKFICEFTLYETSIPIFELTINSGIELTPCVCTTIGITRHLAGRTTMKIFCFYYSESIIVKEIVDIH